MADIAAVNVRMPGTSTRAFRRSWVSARTVRHSAMATTLSGMLTKKIHRQDTPWVSAPPMIGPTAAAAPATAPHMP